MAACAGCGGGGGRQYPKPPAVTAGTAVATPATAPEGYITMEFQGAATGARTYQGKATGQRYRFGNNPGNRKKFVYKEDVPGLLEFLDGGVPLFAVVTESLGTLQSGPVMDAPGPPLQAAPVTAAPMAQPDGPDLREAVPLASAAAAGPMAPAVPVAVADADPIDHTDPETAARAARAVGAVGAAPTAPAPGPAPAVGDVPTAPAQYSPDNPPAPPAPAPMRDMTVHELRDWVKGADIESGDLTIVLAREKRTDGPNRATAINILETALRKRQGAA